MSLGRISRFVKVPAGARRLGVMRTGNQGMKALAPSMDLIKALSAEKKKLREGGSKAGAAHAEAFRRVDFAGRYRREILGNPGSVKALKGVIEDSRKGDVYLMCMCPPRTPGRACHTYLLLDLAREMDSGVKLLKEPGPGA